MATIIPVSFKKDEMELYNEVLKHSDKSSFIKECISFYLGNRSTIKNTTPTYEYGVDSMGISNEILRL